ncbi:TetR/AcrR family transcriptional regulator [Streptomyces phyllanthi]|uniref:TetR/AcrR family transcriptional regulator n=1 Tax=Streptomyces phyllanthi TaxID=1803180 RepID=A0A5N8W276_9ACTN|nr:TetR/AcrR family transcriptional regulator [Streptomyces phyllanthi]MPY41597.1 TetR/AcrR family transcriptional regulator [Streptomyces phyllanthi]
MDHEAATTKRPPSGARAEQKRAAIIAAARETFLKEGFAAGVDLIATNAGVSKVTVYNHFGSKEALFTAVIADALDAPVGGTLVTAVDQLAEADDLRKALTEAAQAWVASVRDNPDVLAMRNLVARELHRFPDLGKAWQHQPPGHHHPAVAGALEQLVAKGRLAIPDLEVAIIQLYSLLLYPQLVFSSYGTELNADLTDRLIAQGVEMFLDHYATPDAKAPS